MKRYKRIVAILLTCTMILTLGGCGNLRRNISKWLEAAKDYYEDHKFQFISKKQE